MEPQDSVEKGLINPGRDPFIRPLIGIITLLITGRGPPCWRIFLLFRVCFSDFFGSLVPKITWDSLILLWELTSKLIFQLQAVPIPKKKTKEKRHLLTNYPPFTVFFKKNCQFVNFSIHPPNQRYLWRSSSPSSDLMSPPTLSFTPANNKKINQRKKKPREFLPGFLS